MECNLRKEGGKDKKWLLDGGHVMRRTGFTIEQDFTIAISGNATVNGATAEWVAAVSGEQGCWGDRHQGMERPSCRVRCISRY